MTPPPDLVRWLPSAYGRIGSPRPLAGLLLGTEVPGTCHRPRELRRRTTRRSAFDLEGSRLVLAALALDLRVLAAHHTIRDVGVEDPVAAARFRGARQRRAVLEAALRGALPAVLPAVPAEAEGDLPAVLAVGFELRAQLVRPAIDPVVAPAEGRAVLALLGL